MDHEFIFFTYDICIVSYPILFLVEKNKIKVWGEGHFLVLIVKSMESGALPGKMLLVRIIEKHY